MRGGGKNFAAESALDKPAVIHDAYSICSLRDHGQIVADQQQRKTKVLLHMTKQIQYLRLQGCVHSADRLIRNQKPGVIAYGKGNSDPLTRPTRKLK